MQYFAGLDVSMEETRVCVVTRNDTVVLSEEETVSVVSGYSHPHHRLAEVCHKRLGKNPIWPLRLAYCR